MTPVKNGGITVQQTIWEGSYANDFFPVLEKHIRDNFAKLIAAPLLSEFEGVVSHIIGQADRTCMVEVESIHRQLADIREHLDSDSKEISDTLDEYHKDLMLLPELMKESSENIEMLYVGYSTPEKLRDSKIYNDPKIKKSVLPALTLVIIEPIQSLGSISEGVTQSLKAGKTNFNGTKADNLSPAHTRRLISICRNLTWSGYDKEIATNGKKIKAAWDSEKEELQKMNEVIHSFSVDLSLLMQEIYEKNLERENQRIQELLEEIVKVFIDHLNNYIKNLNLMLRLEFSFSRLSSIQPENSADIEFEIFPEKKNKKERNPWLLWLSERHVSHAEIPSADDLHSVINDHLKSVINIAATPLTEAIAKYYDEINIKMKEYIDSIKADVEAKFETTYKEHETRHQHHKKNWVNLREIASVVYSDMQDLATHKV